MGFESRAISARVTKLIDTIFSKTCENKRYIALHMWLSLYPYNPGVLFMRHRHTEYPKM